MLDIATSAVLDRYVSEFRSRVMERPRCWHLVAQADIRCRSEHWPQELRQQEVFYTAPFQCQAFHQLSRGIQSSRPAPTTRNSGPREFEKPALLFQMSGSVPEPPQPVGARPPTEQKRGFDPQRRDGPYFKSKSGINICYDWLRHPDGCNNEACVKGMASVSGADSLTDPLIVHSGPAGSPKLRSRKGQLTRPWQGPRQTAQALLKFH